MKKLFKFIAVLIAAVIVAGIVMPESQFSKITAETSSFFKGNSVKLLEDSENKYYYSKLDTTQKLAYVIILNSVKKYPSHIVVPSLSDNELTGMYEALIYDNPDLYFLSHSCSVESYGKLKLFIPDYIMTEQQYKTYQTQIDKKTSEIMSSVNYSMTDFEKELTIHDALAENITYTDNDNAAEASIAGALANGNANCEGYAKAAKYLLEKAGITSRVVIGTATDPVSRTSESHMWNVVTLNGNEYELDVTWDDYVISSDGNESESSEPSHMFFNVTADDVSATHSPSSAADTAFCTSTDMNYFVAKGLYYSVYDANTINSEVNAAADALSAGKNSVEFRFADEGSYAAAKAAMINKGGALSVIKSASKKSSVYANPNKYGCISDDSMHTIRIFFYLS